MKLTFLGTNSMVPTKERNVTGHFLEYDGHGILVDCGEGTQRQMNKAGINRLRVNKILITHWHGDHVAGLIGLLQTIGNEENAPTIEIYGPPGTKQNLMYLMKATLHSSNLEIGVKELDPAGVEKFSEEEDYYLEAVWMDHQVDCLAYRFVEKDKRKIDMNKANRLGLEEGPKIGELKEGQEVETDNSVIKPEDVSYIEEGRKVTFIMDTLLNDNCYDISQRSDLLVCEATFLSDLEEKATEFKHLTAEQAAQIADEAEVKRLILTHFSQRYRDTQSLVEEAKKIFANTQAAEDFMEVEI